MKTLFTRRNDDGLHVVVSEYTHPEKPHVTLLPMIHVADKLYYDEMYWERAANDVVLMEGAELPFGKNIMRAYRIFTRISREKFYPQGGYRKFNRKTSSQWQRPDSGGAMEYIHRSTCSCRQCYDYKIRFIRADLDANQSRKALSFIPIWQIALGMLSAPFLAVYAALFMKRKELIGSLSENDDFGRGSDDFLNRFKTYVFDARETFLIKVLSAETLNPDNSGLRIGVEYGAGHMIVLHRWLLKNGYEMGECREVLAISSDKKLIADQREYGVDRAYWRFDYIRGRGQHAVKTFGNRIAGVYEFYGIEAEELPEYPIRRKKSPEPKMSFSMKIPNTVRAKFNQAHKDNLALIEKVKTSYGSMDTRAWQKERAIAGTDCQ